MMTVNNDIADPRWYAVWTRSRHEHLVSQQLATKAIEHFLPTITRWSRWKDRRKKIDWPLFPGYCFARIGLTDLLRVRTCSGVVGIVSAAGCPCIIPDREIASLQTIVHGDIQLDPCPLVAEGVLVQVVHGPFLGVVGRVVRKHAGRATVVVAVTSIGQAVHIELHSADIEPFEETLPLVAVRHAS
jgi:transcription antitermination factor NusG